MKEIAVLHNYSLKYISEQFFLMKVAVYFLNYKVKLFMVSYVSGKHIFVYVLRRVVVAY